MRLIRLFKITNSEAELQALEAPNAGRAAAPPIGKTKPIPSVVRRTKRGGGNATAVATRIRCAVVLHSCGRHDDARAAFDALLRDPSLGGSVSVRPMVESQIYDTIRVCLEREGALEAALAPALLSHCYRGHFFRLQGRHRELEQLRAAASFDSHFAPLFRRAQRMRSLPAARRLVERFLQDVPDFDIPGLQGALGELGFGASVPSVGNIYGDQSGNGPAVAGESDPSDTAIGLRNDNRRSHGASRDIPPALA